MDRRIRRRNAAANDGLQHLAKRRTRGDSAVGSNTGGTELSESFLKLNPAGTLLGWFTPYNWQYLNSVDHDLGCQGPLLVRDTILKRDLVIAGGKEGVLYVVDRNNMGHFDPIVDHVVQSFQ